MKLNIKETVSFLRGLLWASCIIIGTLMLFRLLFVFLYVPGNILTAHSSDLYKVLYNALRFDFQIAAYAATHGHHAHTAVCFYTQVSKMV